MVKDAQAGSRPSPDALLAQAMAEGRGRLKIFLGAAPGVGKTYEMLQAGRAKLADGLDVVVAVVETHGRSETAKLVEGLEVLPRMNLSYRGRVVEEMDLDALLARKPALALVDELAHSNAPGARHAKRYLDVEEILAAGIDVYTTLNIQHVESLNDVVARITRIHVRETVPDRILDRADDIEVIDLTPDALIQRLKDGKVYVKDQARRAIDHFFKPGNLTALRELALRRTAERVDAQMVNYMQAHGIEGPWAAGERILVLIDETPAAAELIRYAKRMADRLKAPWLALHVETTRDQSLSDDDRDRLTATLRLAERMGAETSTLPASQIGTAVLDLARARNVTHIILGKSKRSRLFEWTHGSVVRDVIAKSEGISVHVIAGDGTAKPVKTKDVRREALSVMPFAIATLYVGLATLVGLGLDAIATLPNLSLIFLGAVLASAARDGRWPGLYAAFLSMLAYNFFFLEPRYTLTIDDPANILAFVFFSLVSVLASGLAARARRQTLAVRAQARRTEALYAFSRKISGIAKLEDLLWASAVQVSKMLEVESAFLMPGPGGDLQVIAGFPPEDDLGPSDIAAAKWAFDRDCATGRGAETLPGAQRLFLPLRTERGKVGVLGIRRRDGEGVLGLAERRLLDALSDQIAVAVERIRLAEDVDAARLSVESERLRSALLTSISHDLRTPLASILGAVTSLRGLSDRHDPAAVSELQATIQDEAERLNRFLANLMNMTRLESGAVVPTLEAFDLADLIGAALQRTARLTAHHKIDVVLDPDLPMVRLDFVLMEQVLANLIDNAAKYAPGDTTIGILARHSDNGLSLEVTDQGPGIPAEDLARVFDKFYRVQAGDRQRAGTGLGLSICRGFVEALGGTIEARQGPGGGASFLITFPENVIAPAPLHLTRLHDH